MRILKKLESAVPHYQCMYYAASIMTECAKAILSMGLTEEDIIEINDLAKEKNERAMVFAYIVGGIEAYAKQSDEMFKDCHIDI